MGQSKRSSLQNITLSADRELIELARARAKAAKTTLNEEFRNWLKQFARATRDEQSYFTVMKKLRQIDSGGTFKREQFYEE